MIAPAIVAIASLKVATSFLRVAMVEIYAGILASKIKLPSRLLLLLGSSLVTYHATATSGRVISRATTEKYLTEKFPVLPTQVFRSTGAWYTIRSASDLSALASIGINKPLSSHSDF